MYQEFESDKQTIVRQFSEDDELEQNNNNYKIMVDRELIVTDEPKPFKHGLMTCCENFGLYCCALRCPCVVFGKIMMKLGRSGKFWCLTYFGVLIMLVFMATIFQMHLVTIQTTPFDRRTKDEVEVYGMICLAVICSVFIVLVCLKIFMRYKVRATKNIQGNICCDAIAACCCQVPVLVQAAREVGVADEDLRASKMFSYNV